MKFFGPHRPERVLLRRNTLYVVQVEIDEKTADIQARSFMARNLNKIGKIL